MDVRRIGIIAFLFAFFVSATEVEAKLLQIIHTNDLHSHMDYAGSQPSRGGYAAVKQVVNFLKLRANLQSIPTLILDAGDFSEGTHFFFAEHGVRSWKAMDEIGYDAVALGNHDYQIGNAGMDFILKHFNPKYALLAANYDVGNGYPYVRDAIQPYVEYQKDGIKIAVIGLTTDSLVYKWTAKPGGDVENPTSVAKKLVPQLRKRNDFVIAITHLGHEEEVQLLKDVPGIDIVIGGHSHTELRKPVYVSRNNSFGITVQAGDHGRFVGDFLVDLKKNATPRVVRYKLVEVNPLVTGEDWGMLNFVAETRAAVDDRFGRQGWLDEVIGVTKIPMDRPVNGNTAWSGIFPKAYRLAAKADLAFDVGEFYGPSQPKGNITREKLLRYFPRTFDIFDDAGWTVWTIRLTGATITQVIKQAAKVGFFFNTDNITYRTIIDKNGKIDLTDFKVGGQKISLLRSYKVATSEGLGRGASKAHWLASLIANAEDTGIPIWTSVEAQIRQQYPVKP